MSRLAKTMKKFWHKRVLGRTRSGPYRFAIRRWDKVSDVGLASNLLKTHFFEYELKPQTLPVTSLESMLVLAPHQDDEVIGAGGTMLLAKQAGAKLDVLFITDGRSKGATPFGGTPVETVRVRYREAEEVCRRLDAGIHFLGINNASPSPQTEDLEKLGRLVSDLRPQVLLVPWVLDTPKHRIVNHLLWLSDHLEPLPACEVWGYQVHNVPLPNGYVDITEVFDQRQKLIRSYASQMTHVRRYDHIAMGMAAWNCRFLPDYKGDPRERYVEIFCALPLREHLRLIEKFYFTDIEATYRGIEMAGAMRRLHNRVVG